jgi:hypothetical protein
LRRSEPRATCPPTSTYHPPPLLMGASPFADRVRHRVCVVCCVCCVRVASVLQRLGPDVPQPAERYRLGAVHQPLGQAFVGGFVLGLGAVQPVPGELHGALPQSALRPGRARRSPHQVGHGTLFGLLFPLCVRVRWCACAVVRVRSCVCVA